MPMPCPPAVPVDPTFDPARLATPLRTDAAGGAAPEGTGLERPAGRARRRLGRAPR
jgi:hypothetical protein